MYVWYNKEHVVYTLHIRQSLRFHQPKTLVNAAALTVHDLIAFKLEISALEPIAIF